MDARERETRETHAIHGDFLQTEWFLEQLGVIERSTDRSTGNSSFEGKEGNHFNENLQWKRREGSLNVVL